MLLPIHFSVPKGIDFDFEKDRFNVIWYSRFEEWYVITWEHIRGDLGEGEVGGNIGQSLWNGRELKGWDWFGLNIGQPNERQRQIESVSLDPRSRVNPNVGKYGIPPMVASRLFNKSNRVWFQSKRWD